VSSFKAGLRAMRSLPLVAADGCTLSPEGLAAQRARAARLAPAVDEVSGSPDELRVAFGREVDHRVLAELIATESVCCSFLDLGYDERTRVLRVASRDERGREVVATLTGFFSAEGDR
jgi:hypothetical protein